MLQCSLHKNTDGNHGAFTLSGVSSTYSGDRASAVLREWTKFSPTSLGKRKGGVGAGS